MTNFCDKCGDKIKDNVKFCDDCWKFLNDPESRNEKLVKNLQQNSQTCLKK